jgi:hypothetical protein
MRAPHALTLTDPFDRASAKWIVVQPTRRLNPRSHIPLREPLPLKACSTEITGGSGDDFRAGIERAIALGWLWLHESGTYVKFTDDGAALFAREPNSRRLTLIA